MQINNSSNNIPNSSTQFNSQVQQKPHFKPIRIDNLYRKIPSNQTAIHQNQPNSTLGEVVKNLDKGIINYLNSKVDKSGVSPKLSTINLNDLKIVRDTLSMLSDPQKSKDQKAIAVTQLFNRLSQVDFTGTVNSPKVVDGSRVVGSAETKDGKHGFILENGKIVDRDSLVTAQNLNVALNTLNILQGNTTGTNQILGIAGNAIVLANANDFLSDTNAGYLSSAIGVAGLITNWRNLNDKDRLQGISNLAPVIVDGAAELGVDLAQSNLGSLNALTGVANTVVGWDEMKDEQRVGSVSQAGLATINTMDDLGVSIVGGTAASALGVVAGGASIVTGIKQGVDVFEAIKDMPRSEASRYGAVGVGSAGAAIGAGIGTIAAVSSGLATGAAAATAGAAAGAQAGSLAFPVIGTIIGAVVGAAAGFLVGKFGSGKSGDQMMRDSWRSAMEKLGFAEKINGSHHVQLADGSKFNIGVDGGHKFLNTDGTQRHTFDVDWSNPLASEGIPEAHIFAIATGLDPSLEKGALWHRGVAQALNAATSNATSSEMVSENLRSMLAKGNVNPIDIALKIEILRQDDIINEQDYGIYVNKINHLFGTELVPVEREQAFAALIENGYKPKE